MWGQTSLYFISLEHSLQGMGLLTIGYMLCYPDISSPKELTQITAFQLGSLHYAQVCLVRHPTVQVNAQSDKTGIERLVGGLGK